MQRWALLLEVGIQIQGGDAGAAGSAQALAGTASSELRATY